MCVTLSTFLLQSLKLGVPLVLPMLYFTELLHWITILLIACSCAAQRRLPVSLFSSPFLNYSHFLLSLWQSVSLTNCPCNAFCFHSFNRFSFFSFLFALTMYFSKLISAVAILTKAFLICVACFDRLHFSSWTQSSTCTKPFFHHFLVCSLSTHDLGWSSLYMVMSFLVFLSIFWSSSFVDCIIPAPYRTVGTAQILIA